MKLFLKYAKQRVCVIRSLKIAVVVVGGTILAFLNHYDPILWGSVNATTIFQIILTYAVPYSVATFGSAMQAGQMELMENQRKSDITNSGDLGGAVRTEDKHLIGGRNY